MNCETCKFFQSQDTMGNCRRFPAVQPKHKTNWCGEHYPLTARGEAIVLPVIDVMTEPKKKLGRPKKVRIEDAQAAA